MKCDRSPRPRAAARNIRFARILAAIGDVVADRVVEQHGILRDDADRGAQRGLGDVADILPVDQDPAAGDFVEAEQQPRDRRFAGTRRADDRELGARRERRGRAPSRSCGHRRHSRNGHDRSGSRRAARPSGPVASASTISAGRVEQLEHRLHVDQTLLDRAIDRAEQIERAEKLHQQRVDQHDVADGE